MTVTPFDAETEFDRQLDRLVQLGYPALAGLPETAFRDLVAPLRVRAVEGTADLPAPTDARVPFLLVITRDLIGVVERLELTTLDGKRKPGLLDRNYAEADLPRFDPIKSWRCRPGRRTCSSTSTGARSFATCPRAPPWKG